MGMVRIETESVNCVVDISIISVVANAARKGNTSQVMKECGPCNTSPLLENLDGMQDLIQPRVCIYMQMVPELVVGNGQKKPDESFTILTPTDSSGQAAPAGPPLEPQSSQCPSVP